VNEVQLRKCCVVCGGNVMVPAAQLARFPVFQGTVATPPGEGERAPITWIACASCGSAQIETLPPHSQIYQAGHATGLGQAWARHHAALAQFIKLQAQGPIVDIGGGSGTLALAYRNSGGLAPWAILEPSAMPAPDLPRDVDVAVGELAASNLARLAPRTAVLCHVLEHLPALQDAVATLAACESLSRVILAWPVLERWTARALAGALNFEHCTYVTLATLKALFGAQGWHLHAEAQWRENDTAFLSFARGEPLREHVAQGTARDAVGAIGAFYAHFQITALQIDRAVAMHRGDAYLMPASVYAQTLLASGLKETRFRAVLDNAPLKQGQRLYGTSLQVLDPANILADADNPLVVLNGGPHTPEIIRALRTLRDDVDILKVGEGAAGSETTSKV